MIGDIGLAVGGRAEPDRLAGSGSSLHLVPSVEIAALHGHQSELETCGCRQRGKFRKLEVRVFARNSAVGERFGDHHAEGRSIGRLACQLLGQVETAVARRLLRQHLPAVLLLQTLRDQTGLRVGTASSRKPDQHLDGSGRRPAVGRCVGRRGNERGRKGQRSK
jgi:hypothetical protein